MGRCARCGEWYAWWSAHLEGCKASANVRLAPFFAQINDFLNGRTRG